MAPSQSRWALYQRWHKQSPGEGKQGNWLLLGDGCVLQSSCFLTTHPQQPVHPEKATDGQSKTGCNTTTLTTLQVIPQDLPVWLYAVVLCTCKFRQNSIYLFYCLWYWFRQGSRVANTCHTAIAYNVKPTVQQNRKQLILVKQGPSNRAENY